MKDDSLEFQQRNAEYIKQMSEDVSLQNLTIEWFQKASEYEYPYHFSWLGRPIIQFPQDIVMMQEIIWEVQPDLIVETGIARGGSLIFYASMLELLGGEREVLGIDIDIRAHNKVAIEQHPMFERIKMIQGSSVDEEIVKQVYKIAEGKQKILVAFDSKHTHEHVLKELELYSPLVTQGSYLVVFDTIVEDMPPEFFSNRPWNKGNNPKTAVYEFLSKNDRFEIDKTINAKLLITGSPDGYLKCIKD
jgi:cephalosporin hydroxylase